VWDWDVGSVHLGDQRTCTTGRHPLPGKGSYRTDDEKSRVLRTKAAYCSGARRDKIAVCGSFSCLPILANGTCVSPVETE
jgi:hypothetical protein